MAPRETPKATPKVKTVASRTNTTKSRSSPVAVKKTMPLKKPASLQSAEKLPKAETVETRQRTLTVPKVTTPKAKEKLPMPGSVTKSVKKNPAWKRRPKPAHSGVPVPEKMRKLFEKL